MTSTLTWASLSTLSVFIPGAFIAYALARHRFPGKKLISTVVTLPMVLPPTAVGYLLLSLLADEGWLGREHLGFSLDILLTWKGVVLACAVMSTPLVIRTARVSFEEVNPRYEAMAHTLGYGRLQTFFRITLPLAWRGLLAAAVLGFTRAMGEFGATVIVAGNIPGRTQTLSSAIYSAQQAGNDQQANFLLVVALAIGFMAVFLTEWLADSTHKPSRRAS
ncbi:MAG: molybdate transport system permease protein [Puniceicoccaceae bacterium 5H]|nr:MAG: molybdate transport system permease protein [Puniceicoccaceae bacterium 5H]